jgi:hypothetical protein
MSAELAVERAAAGVEEMDVVVGVALDALP